MREAGILLILLNHPSLMAKHLEDMADLEFASSDAARLRDGLAGLAADGIEDYLAVGHALDEAGLADVRRRIEAVDVVASLWCVKPEAAERDAEGALRQALALHRRSRALHKDLKSAEKELADDPSDDNIARMRDIQAEIATLDGREAALEGFGILSGRTPKVF